MYLRFRILPLVFLSVFSLAAQIPCIDGKAGVYACNQVDLMVQIPPQALLADDVEGVFLNDIWGWTDAPSGREFVLVGMTNGTSFVEITNPTSPQVLGILPEHEVATSGGRIAHDGFAHEDVHGEAKSLWRDIKTYDHYAFIVSEDTAGGMQVFDLNQLLSVQNAPVVFNESAHYDDIGNAHNIVINEATGFAYAVGATNSNICSVGGLHIIDISDPLNPTFAGCFDADGYTHDAQCVIYGGADSEYLGREICFNSNENSVAIVDVTDKQNIKLISNTTYSEASYTHQGWLSSDQNYFFSNDELDELTGAVQQTATYVWDIRDLDEPFLDRRYDHGRSTIDHNLYVNDKQIFQSNYTTGLVILDEELLTSEQAVAEVAFFDTYPENNQIDFRGSWSNYPFFESGVVALTDMTHGLFLVQPNIEVTILSMADDLEVCEGDSGMIIVDVREQDISFQWQLLTETGYADLDSDQVFSNTNSASLIYTDYPLEVGVQKLRCKLTTASGKLYFTEPVTISVNAAPVAAFSFEIDNNSVTFFNESLGADAFVWDFGFDERLDSLNTVSIVVYPFESSTYSVMLTVRNECGFDSIQQDISLEVLSTEQKTLKLYPNPVSDGKLSLEIGRNLNVHFVEIFDSAGKIQKRSNEASFDVSMLSSGWYTLLIHTTGGVITSKVIITN